MLLCALCGAFITARAQYDAIFSYYWETDFLQNPAAMNKNETLNIVASYSMKMAGYTRAPKTMFIGANSVLPFGMERHSVGLVVLNDHAGLYIHNRLYLNYAFKFNLLGGALNIGVQGGFLQEQFNNSKLDIVDSNDPAFPTSKENGSSVDFGAGLYYSCPSWYLGFSSNHLASPVVYYGKGNTVSARLTLHPQFNFEGGYNINLKNSLLSLHPSFQVQTDMRGSFRADITMRGVYTIERNALFAALGYSPLTSVSVMIGGRIKDISLGYAYEIYTSGVGALNGGHDLFLSYSKVMDFGGKRKNVHKTVRYL
ncbi:MAG: PorP/SprF family type IX secretion system membrane protein [Bacteroidaceae bacterium]|nr:PorP/SprF family type IX secretion system membrane protein [Bacteroidaceae bacterium]